MEPISRLGPVRGGTPLHLAVSQRHKEVVRLLFTSGANPKAKNVEGHTLVSTARDIKDRYLLYNLREAASWKTEPFLFTPFLIGQRQLIKLRRTLATSDALYVEPLELVGKLFTRCLSYVQVFYEQ